MDFFFLFALCFNVRRLGVCTFELGWDWTGLDGIEWTLLDQRGVGNIYNLILKEVDFCRFECVVLGGFCGMDYHSGGYGVFTCHGME